MKVIGGESISTDNTCNTYIALRNFFTDAPKELDTLITVYKSLYQHPRVEKKYTTHILTQLYDYQRLFTAINQRSTATMATNSYQAHIPPGLHAMVLDSRTSRDNFLKSTSPIFSVSHKRFGDGLTEQYSVLGQVLRQTFTNIHLDNIKKPGPTVETYKNQVRALVNENKMGLYISEYDEDNLNKLHNVWQELHYPEAAWEQAKGALETRMNDIKYQSDLDGEYDPDQLISALNDIAGIIFQGEDNNHFHSYATDIAYSKMDAATKADKLSVLTQFFLATVNIYLHDKHNYQNNLGAAFDTSRDLSIDLADKIKAALETGDKVEKSIGEFLVEKGCIPAMSSDDMAAIKATFSTQYAIIRDSQHMDEFFVKPQKTSSCWFEYGGAMSVELCAFAYHIAIQENIDFIQKKIANFKQVKRTVDNRILYTGDPLLALINKCVEDKSPLDILLFIMIKNPIVNRAFFTTLISTMGPAINTRNEDRLTPLHMAIQYGQVDLAKELIAAKEIELNVTDHHGYTPMYWAIIKYHGHIVKMLINAGADINASGPNQPPPLWYALKKKNVYMERKLILFGAKFSKLPIWTTGYTLRILYAKIFDKKNGITPSISDVPPISATDDFDRNANIRHASSNAYTLADNNAHEPRQAEHTPTL